MQSDKISTPVIMCRWCKDQCSRKTELRCSFLKWTPFTVMLTNKLFVFATSIWDVQQKTKSFRLVVILDLGAAEDVQEDDNAPALQELHQVLIAVRRRGQSSGAKLQTGDGAAGSLTGWKQKEKSQEPSAGEPRSLQPWICVHLWRPSEQFREEKEKSGMEVTWIQQVTHGG